MKNNRAIVAETSEEDPRYMGEYASDLSGSVKMQVTVEDSNGGVLKQETINDVTAFELDIPFIKRWKVSNIKVNVEEVTIEQEDG